MRQSPTKPGTMLPELTWRRRGTVRAARACGLALLVGSTIIFNCTLSRAASTAAAADNAERVAAAAEEEADATAAAARAAGVFVPEGGSVDAFVPEGGGVDAREETVARLAEVMRHVQQALVPFQQNYRYRQARARLPTRDVALAMCMEADATPGYLPGCPETGCLVADTAGRAKALCLADATCGGVTQTGGHFEIRASEHAHQPAGTTGEVSTGEVSWRVVPCDPVAFDRAHLAPGQHWQAAEPTLIWEAFATAMERTWLDPAMRLREAPPPVRDDASIFVGIGAYRDASCAPTLRRAFGSADAPCPARQRKIGRAHV